MGLEFVDSFAHSGVKGGTPAPIDIFYKWTTAGGSGGASYANATQGAPGGGGAPVRATGYCIVLGGVYKTLPNYVSERFVGVAYWYSSGSSEGFPIYFLSGGTNLVFLKIEADNTLSVYGGGNLLANTGTGGYILTPDVYHYLEINCAIAGASPITASGAVRVDGNVVLNYSGNTTTNANQLLIQDALMNGVGLTGALGDVGFAYACDCYILNTDATDIFGAATTNITFLGDVNIFPTVPIQDVTTTWQPVPSTANSYENVSLIPPIDDDSYVYTDTVNNIESFLFTPIEGFDGTIFGAQLLVYAKKDAEGSRAFRPVIASGTFSGADSYLYDYYDYFIWTMDTNNGTSWTPANFNTQDFGAKLTI